MGVSALGRTPFFRGIRKSGAVILFCGNAVVYEEVPVGRMSLRWARRRAISNGIVGPWVALKHHSFLLVGLMKGVRTVAYGIVMLGIGLARGRGLQARSCVTVFFTNGRFAGLFKRRIEPNARTGE